MSDTPNFLTCPAFPELTPPKETEVTHASEQPVEDKGHMMPVAQPAPPFPPAPPVEIPQAGPPHPRAKRRVPVWRIVRWTIGLLFVALVVSVAVPAYSLYDAFASAQEAKSALKSAAEHAKALDLEATKTDIDTARAALEDARISLRNVGFWRDVPGIGVQIRGLEDAAAAGAQTLDGVRDLASVFQVVTDSLKSGSPTDVLKTGIAPSRRFQDLTKEEKRDLLRKFSNALPDLRVARDKIDLALELWNRVPQNSLAGPIRTALAPLAQNLPSVKTALDQAVPLIETLVPLAGYPKPMNYLVILQNADELRPGGGFVGNVGTMKFDAGDLTEIGFTDIYNIDNPASYAWKEVPPKPIAEQLGVKAWYMRDANWSPDFPTSASTLLDFYVRELELGTGKKVADPPNAVLALEPGLFKSILHLTGPVTVEGTSYDENNFFDQIQYQVEQGFLKQGISLEQRKDIVGKIGTAIIDKLKAFPASRWGEITDLVTKALERKQIMAFAQDPEVLSILDHRGWTARAKATNGDFVWVVDANLAALKTDGVMNKTVNYTLDATDPTKPIATVNLHYKNTNTQITWRYTRYRSYTRVYVPEGSALLSSSDMSKAGAVDVTKELGKTVFGAFWVIEPGRTGDLTFTYELPPSAVAGVADGTYHLDFPKQPGADSTTLTLGLLFGKNIQSAQPPEDPTKFGDTRYEYETDSLQDRAFNLSFK